MVQRDRHLADGAQPLGPHQVALGRGQRLAQLAGPAHPLEHLGQQLGEGGILGQVVVRAPAERRGGERLVAVRGDHDDGGRMGPGADRVEHLETAGVGKLMVEQDDVGIVERRPAPRARSRRRRPR